MASKTSNTNIRSPILDAPSSTSKGKIVPISLYE